MRIGVSLSYDMWLRDGGDVFGDRDAFFAALSDADVASVELRVVGPGESPEKAARVANELWDRGFRISVHGAIRRLDAAADDLFGPLSLVLAHMRQKELVIVVHPPVTDDLPGLLRSLSAEIDRRRIPVKIALENNRKMPDGTPGDSAALVAKAVCEANAPHIGICFDMGHFYYHAIKNVGDPTLLPSEDFLKNVIHTHIHGTLDGNTHFPLTEEYELPIESYVDALGIGYEGLYNLELEPPRFADRMEAAPAVLESVRTLTAAVSYRRMLLNDIEAHFVERMRAAVSVWDGNDNAVSQMNCSSYCLRYAGVNIAVDPSIRMAMQLTDAADHLKECFKKAQYILISHEHDDHFEKETVEKLRGTGITWVIPYYLADQAHCFGLSDSEILWAYDREPLTLDGVTVTPFASRHYRHGTKKGVAEYGYYFTAPGAPSLLFPGDIRDYSVETMPEGFRGVDWLFAHVWLGDFVCLKTHYEPYDSEMTAFMTAFEPKNVIFGHIYESGRRDTALWRREHAEYIGDCIRAARPGTRTFVLPAGETIKL